MAVKIANGMATSRNRSPAGWSLLNSPPARSRGLITGRDTRSRRAVANQRPAAGDKSRLYSERRNGRGELLDRLRVRIPAGDEPHLAVTPFVEVEPLGPQRVSLGIGHPKEQFIRFDGVHQAAARGVPKHLRGGVGGAGIVEPQPAL